MLRVLIENLQDESSSDSRWDRGKAKKMSKTPLCQDPVRQDVKLPSFPREEPTSVFYLWFPAAVGGYSSVKFPLEPRREFQDEDFLVSSFFESVLYQVLMLPVGIGGVLQLSDHYFLACGYIPKDAPCRCSVDALRSQVVVSQERFAFVALLSLSPVSALYINVWGL